MPIRFARKLFPDATAVSSQLFWYEREELFLLCSQAWQALLWELPLTACFQKISEDAFLLLDIQRLNKKVTLRFYLKLLNIASHLEHSSKHKAGDISRNQEKYSYCFASSFSQPLLFLTFITCQGFFN